MGDGVAPGHTNIYEFEVPPTSAYGSTSSRFWLYHSHVDETADTNAGLIGAIVVTKRGMQTSSTNLKPKDVDAEFVSIFHEFNENATPYYDQNARKLLHIKHNKTWVNRTDQMRLTMLEKSKDFIESNRMYSINGMVFANLNGLHMTKGDQVRWYVGSIGNVEGIHAAHWHGQVVRYNGMAVDVLNLMPATQYTVDMLADNPGTWVYHCHVNHHIHAGMYALYTVKDNQKEVDYSKWDSKVEAPDHDMHNTNSFMWGMLGGVVGSAILNIGMYVKIHGWMGKEDANEVIPIPTNQDSPRIL